MPITPGHRLVLVLGALAAWLVTLAPLQPSKAQGALTKAAAASGAGTPDAEQTLILIRSTLLSLNDALRTGNFTVVRDLAAPSFREANTAGRLAQAFSDLAGSGVDLAAVAILVPLLPQAPVIDQDARLKISGVFPGQPVQIKFDLQFEASAGRWRLFGISVDPIRVSRIAEPPAALLPAIEKATSWNTKTRQSK